MDLSQVALQLYTLREHCKTAADLAVTLKKVRAIGYTAVQISGVGPIADEEIVAIAQGEGLTICATHEPGAEILDNTQRVIDRLGRLGCTVTAYPYPAGFDLTDPRQIDALIAKLDAAGAKLQAAGQVLGYHNHGIEFLKTGGTTVLEQIYARTSPQHLVGEIDTYWIHYGGGDVVEWCRRLRGRLPFIHLKDYAFTTDNKPNYCELGRGTLDFTRIIAEAERSGCTWFIVEQDSCPGDPFDSVRVSYEHLRDHLVN